MSLLLKLKKKAIEFVFYNRGKVMDSMYGTFSFNKALQSAKLYLKFYPLICKMLRGELKKGEATLKDILVSEALVSRAKQGFLETSRDNFYK